MSPSAAASAAPASALCSQGCTTAVVTGARLLQRATRCSYFPVPVSCAMDALYDVAATGTCWQPALGLAAGGARHERAEHRCQQRAECEVEEIDDSGGCAAELGRIGFLDH